MSRRNEDLRPVLSNNPYAPPKECGWEGRNKDKRDSTLNNLLLGLSNGGAGAYIGGSLGVACGLFYKAIAENYFSYAVENEVIYGLGLGLAVVGAVTVLPWPFEDRYRI